MLEKNISKYHGNLLKFELLVPSSKRVRDNYCFSLKCFCLQIAGNFVSGDFKYKALFFSQITVRSEASTWGCWTSQTRAFLSPPSSLASGLSSPYRLLHSCLGLLHFKASGPCSGQSTVGVAKCRRGHTCLNFF